jgi:hypothetical protein
MGNRILLLIFGTLLAANYSFAQKCGTYEGSLEEDMQKHPVFYQSLESKNNELKLQNDKALSRLQNLKTENGVKIIPVVVHVIHDLGNENISDASIQGALDILNENINGQADNFLSRTPDIFAAVRGDAKLEFRLAKLDPLGNPTTGINRVRSTLTDEPDPRDEVKALSYWNSYQYFNIWTVKRFLPQDDGNTLLGYAQFPDTRFMSTDGVVLLSSQMVSGGTLTHETGHWLGLRHTWGDATCGDDGVKDTPPARGPNYGINLSDFPYHAGLSPPPPITGVWGCIADSLNPAGEMFVNYMDYSNDAAVTMFTMDQNSIMDFTLDGAYDESTGVSGIGFREYMWSEENVAATGTSDGFQVPTCTQEATFVVMNGASSLCEGEALLLKGNQTMFGSNNVDSFIWDFGDGTSDDSNSNFLSHTYNSVGSYDVTLTVIYNEITEARASSLSDLNLVAASSFDSIVENLIVQGTEAELNILGASNISLYLDNEGYSLGSYWKRNQFTVDSLLGASSIDAFQVNEIEDELILYLSDNISMPDTVFINSDSTEYYIIDGDNLSNQDLTTLQTPEYNADSSVVFITDYYVDYLDSIVDYNFYYDTTIIDILTFIDSTYLTSSDSLLFIGADSLWSVDGLLNSSDSIRIYFAQFNISSTITISVNTDTASLSSSDSLMFNDADSVWNINAFIGWVDTVRTFYGSHYYTKYNGYYVDTLFYRGNLDKVTYVAYYENTCTSSVTKEDFVTVNSINTSSNASSYSYSFESESDLNGDWILSQSTNIESQWSFSPGENTTWQWQSGTAADGSSSIKVDAENMLIGVSAEIISKAYDLSAFVSPAIKFSWSGASINTFPVNELVVTYSDDCGESWRSLGKIEAVEASNAGLYSSSFTPDSYEWSNIVMTNTQIKNSNIRFKFEYVVNGSSNNFYLDHIQIGEEASLMISESTTNSKLYVFPNPTKDYATIALANMTDKNTEVTLINILGDEVAKLFSGTVVSKYQEIASDLSRFDKGIYFVKVVNNGNVILTDKLIIE